MLIEFLRRLKNRSKRSGDEIQTRSDAVIYANTVLPRNDLRYCGPKLQSDAYFLESAEAEANRLVEKCGLNANSRVLDVGCGVGRLAIGLIKALGKVDLYRGVDVSARSIDWCNRHIASKSKAFEFTRIDVKNERYNPDGKGLTKEFSFPYEDRTFDVIYLYSVFSHMTEGDVRLYLKEFHRLSTTTGKVFCTAFVEDDVPVIAVNPDNYRMTWKGALHCVRYNKKFFGELLEQHGFVVDRFEYGTETDGQSGLYLSKKTSGIRQ